MPGMSRFPYLGTGGVNTEIYGILREFNVAFCIYELAGYRSPISVTADFTYVRLHGPARAKYPGSYNPQQLSQWARPDRILGKRAQSHLRLF
jgi:uncharacterized protein YecE (DUF72 family)